MWKFTKTPQPRPELPDTTIRPKCWMKYWTMRPQMSGILWTTCRIQKMASRHTAGGFCPAGRRRRLTESLFLSGPARFKVRRTHTGELRRVSLLLSIILTAAGRIFSRDILLLFGASENTLTYALDYLNLYILGTVFVEFGTGLVYFINAQGFTGTGLIAVLSGAGLNIILDPVFRSCSWLVVGICVCYSSVLWILIHLFPQGFIRILPVTRRCASMPEI